MKSKFDVVVVGSGSAGRSAAAYCRSEGWSVAMVESERFGGTCPFRGCDPKKVLVAGGEAWDWISRLRAQEVIAGDVEIQWRGLIEFKRSFTEPMAKQLKGHLESQGVVTVPGKARLAGPRTVEVNGRSLKGRYLLLATGAMPASLPFKGTEHLTTSDEFMELEELPSRIIFVGGGFISFEFAHVAARAGASVTIMEYQDRVLLPFDEDLVGELVARSRRIGIDVRTESRVEEIAPRNGVYVVRATGPAGQHTMEADLVVHGAGRMANVEGLDLDQAQIRADRRGVAVTEHFRSPTNPAVYAAGDAAATDGPQLTPVAGYEGDLAARNMIQGNKFRATYTGIPRVLFTVPPLAAVGLSESDAEAYGSDVSVQRHNMSSWYFVRRVGETHAVAKVITDTGKDSVLGAHVLGPQADELINVFALAMQLGIPASQLQKLHLAYPTAASNLGSLL